MNNLRCIFVKYFPLGVAGKENSCSYAVISFILQLNNESICAIGGFKKTILTV
jgi:hypothetical protein